MQLLLRRFHKKILIILVCENLMLKNLFTSFM